MVGRYIPTVLALGALLAAYKICGVEKFISGITAKSLEDSYDYIIGKSYGLGAFIELTVNLFERFQCRYIHHTLWVLIFSSILMTC